MTDPFDKLREQVYDDTAAAALTAMDSLLGHARLLEGRQSLDAKEIEELAGLLRSAAKWIDTLSNVVMTKVKRTE